ncbi:MAG TPA: hypothetical protein VH988_02475 [Thermoanaerobaculia bacterium]|nr:hypothetical protein [Thermoanaerobaculia bacterium]
MQDRAQEQNTDFDPKLYRLVLDAVNRQIKGNDPPEPRRTYYRLLAAGYTSDNAHLQIALILCVEIIRSLESRNPFHESRYATALRRLPLLPMLDREPPDSLPATL